MKKMYLAAAMVTLANLQLSSCKSGSKPTQSELFSAGSKGQYIDDGNHCQSVDGLTLTSDKVDKQASGDYKFDVKISNNAGQARECQYRVHVADNTSASEFIVRSSKVVKTIGLQAGAKDIALSIPDISAALVIGNLSKSVRLTMQCRIAGGDFDAGYSLVMPHTEVETKSSKSCGDSGMNPRSQDPATPDKPAVPTPVPTPTTPPVTPAPVPPMPSVPATPSGSGDQPKGSLSVTASGSLFTIAVFYRHPDNAPIETCSYKVVGTAARNGDSVTETTYSGDFEAQPGSVRSSTTDFDEKNLGTSQFRFKQFDLVVDCPSFGTPKNLYAAHPQ